jgi:hypothetical protein
MKGERPIHVVTLRPEPNVDGIRALRALLKAALRRFGLRATNISEEVPTEQTNKSQQANDQTQDSKS